jgi:hypothetical protein
VPPPTRYEAPPAIRNASTISPIIVSLCTAVGIVALLAILYLFVLPRGTASKASTTALEKPGTPARAVVNAHPLAKYIEITGLRVIEGTKGQVKIAFVAVNHSPADLPELDAQLTLTGEGATIFEFKVTIPSIGPYESRDITTNVKTALKPYELPDWQALQPSLNILSER